AFGAPLAGWLSDRMGRRKPLMVIGSLVALITFSALVYIPDLSLTGARVLLFINGFFSGSMVLSFAVGREHNRPETAGATLGFVNMFLMAAGAIFQPLIGWMLDLNWDGTMVEGVRLYSVTTYQTAFLTIVASGTVSLFMGLIMGETYCRNVTQSPSPEKS
ncbi:MAG TPA: MFS transporter, partial [Rhodospirillales bacterium]|nr:MFS transporter [Rhodospirillales bacterium]